jgi:flagellar biosynthesis/type III secretory pathway protein FliH
MLAERVVEWTQEWEQAGFEKGFQQGIAQGREKIVEVLRAKLLTNLEERFGALPDGVRRRVVSIGSIEELAELLSRSGTAPSLASLGLAGD